MAVRVTAPLGMNPPETVGKPARQPSAGMDRRSGTRWKNSGRPSVRQLNDDPMSANTAAPTVLSKDGNAVLKIPEQLRIATQAEIVSVELRYVVSRRPREQSDQTPTATAVPRKLPGPVDWWQHYISRSYVSVERIERANASRWIAANRKLIAEEVALVNRHAVNKRQRVRVSDFVGYRERAHGAGLDAEGEDVRMIAPLVANRVKLCGIRPSAGKSARRQTDPRTPIPPTMNGQTSGRCRRL